MFNILFTYLKMTLQRISDLTECQRLKELICDNASNTVLK